MSENKSPIPGRLYNAADGGYVCGAIDIIDDAKGKSQQVVNQETDNALEDRYTKEETYNKTELNNLITTPDQKYVSVTATDQTTSVTDVLPVTGESDTIYRVGNWDGTEYNTGAYTEYAWNGSSYTPLSKKQPGIDDEPTADSNNLVKSKGLCFNDIYIKINYISKGKYNYMGDIHPGFPTWRCGEIDAIPYRNKYLRIRAGQTTAFNEACYTKSGTTATLINVIETYSTYLLCLIPEDADKILICWLGEGDNKVTPVVALEPNDGDLKKTKSAIGYYICTTVYATAAKTITAPYYQLFIGCSIKIKFNYANSATSGVTLNINNTGAKPLYYNNQLVSNTNTWLNEETVEIYYDGTNYYAYPYKTIEDKPIIGSKNLVSSNGIALNTLFDDIYIKLDNIRTGLWLATGVLSNYTDWRATEVDLTPYRNKYLRIRCGNSTNYHNSCYIRLSDDSIIWLQTCLVKQHNSYNIYLIPSTASTLLVSWQHLNTGSIIPMLAYEPFDESLMSYDDSNFLSYVRKNIDYSQIAEDGYYSFGSINKMPYESSYAIIIDVNEAERYRIKGKIWAHICLYNIVDETGAVLDYFNWEGAGDTSYPQTVFDEVVEIPKNAKKLYISFFKTSPIPIIEQVSCFTPIKDDVIPEYLKYLIGKTICIGDSTTYGYNTIQNENAHGGAQLYGTYPKYFSKMIEADVENAGGPAAGAKIWYNQMSDNYQYSNYETAIINLGTNYGLTDTLTEDTNAENYEDYANTNTGCYCKIIEKILEANPNIHIVLSYPQCRTGLVEEGETMTETSVAICVKVINEIAEKYGLFVIDDRNHYKVSCYQSSDGCHFTRVGNLVRAQTFLEQICSYINTHKEDWKTEYINSL